MPDVPSNALALGVIPPGGGGPPQNPLDNAAKFVGIQNSINQNRLFQQEFAARQRLGQIIAAAPDIDTGFANAYKDPLVAPWAGKYASEYKQALQAQVETEGKIQEQSAKGLQGFEKGLMSFAAAPNEDQWNALTGKHLALLSPHAKKQVTAALGNLKESLLGGLDALPEEARAGEFHKRLAATFLGSGGTREALESFYGKPEILDQGGYRQPGLQAPPQAGGGFTPTGNPLQLTAPAANVTEKFGPQGEVETHQLPGQVPPGASAPSAGAGNPLAVRPPVGPSGAVLRGPSATSQQYFADRGKDMADYQKSLDENVGSGQKMLATIGEIQDTMKNVKLGGGAEFYRKLGELAQAVGVPDALVNKVANGNLAATQEAQKLMVDNIIARAKQQIPAGSRLNMSEFNAFMKENPNINTDPRAIEKVFNFWKHMQDMNVAEQTGLNKWLKDGKDISQWPAEWQRQATERGFVTTEPSYNQNSPPSSAGRPPLSSFVKKAR